MKKGKEGEGGDRIFKRLAQANSSSTWLHPAFVAITHMSFDSSVLWLASGMEQMDGVKPVATDVEPTAAITIGDNIKLPAAMTTAMAQLNQALSRRPRVSLREQEHTS